MALPSNQLVGLSNGDNGLRETFRAVKYDLKITTVEMHVGGDPLRIVTSGFPNIKGDTLFNKMNYLKDHLAYIRNTLILEPRGHHDMHGAVIVQPDSSDADIATLIFNSSGDNVTMCGHSAIAIARFAVDHGYVTPTDPETEVRIQYPCGVVKAAVEFKNGRSGSVKLQSVPAFVYAKGVDVDVTGVGKVKVDICYGGLFFAVLSDDKVDIDLRKTPMTKIREVGALVTKSVQEQVKVDHPDAADLSFVYGTLLTDGKDEDERSMQCCVSDTKLIPRAPCGSGTMARVALQLSRGQISLNETKTFVSAVTGSQYSARPMRKTKCGDFDAVIVEITGRGHYTGTATYITEDGDQLQHGFLV
ncbi:trans-L-3-hydroxyproline dehydratase-like [Ptychodera flava]|uniref:trans-L-3-hydroxyproline dehydratase-like n=1 Tax=Ptychodera flava TaxID=63121 RepID=UPI00396A0F4A